MRIELAQDYLKAGLMDRAESLLNELVERGAHLSRALELLLSIYEQGREWDRAIGVAQQLQSVRGTSCANVIAHYHCEQAERVLAKEPADAVRLVQRAQAADAQCVRASLLAAQLAEQAEDPEGALRALRRVPDQDPRFIPDSARSSAARVAARQERARSMSFSRKPEERHRRRRWRRPAPAASSARDPVAARSFLAERLARHPDWAGLLLWLDWDDAADPSGAPLPALRETLRRQLQQPKVFQCKVARRRAPSIGSARAAKAGGRSRLRRALPHRKIVAYCASPHRGNHGKTGLCNRSDRFSRAQPGGSAGRAGLGGTRPASHRLRRRPTVDRLGVARRVQGDITDARGLRQAMPVGGGRGVPSRRGHQPVGAAACGAKPRQHPWHAQYRARGHWKPAPGA